MKLHKILKELVINEGGKRRRKVNLGALLRMVWPTQGIPNLLHSIIRD